LKGIKTSYCGHCSCPLQAVLHGKTIIM